MQVQSPFVPALLQPLWPTAAAPAHAAAPTRSSTPDPSAALRGRSSPTLGSLLHLKQVLEEYSAALIRARRPGAHSSFAPGAAQNEAR